MSDFYQHGGIATLHRLGNPDFKKLEEELNALRKPLALVLPCHARDLQSPALAEILNELRETRFVSDVIIGLDGADEGAWNVARTLIRELPQSTSILWNDGPRIQALIQELDAAGLHPGPMGKGRNMRLCFGHALGGTQADIIAVHDCDVVNYRREMLVRLCYPVADPEMAFEVSKGFSARFSDRLNGRVMRLLITPLLLAMKELDGFEDSLRPLQNFRYPISGEVCLTRRLIQEIRFPSDWGVESGMMADVFRVCEQGRVCQVDIAESYDHKHQDLSENDPQRGLNKMAMDVALCLLRSVAAGQRVFTESQLNAVVDRYLKIAPEFLKFYAADARMNLLKFDRKLEEHTIELFANSIQRAITSHLHSPMVNAGAPSWNEVEAQLPGFTSRLAEAVKLDNA